MKFSLKRTLATIGAVALTFAGLAAVGSPATAAPAPYKGAFITLLTPKLDETNTSEAGPNQAMANTWIDAGWFASGLKYQRSFAPVGSSVTFTYHVADKDGNALVGQSITLRINKQYSTSQAAVTVDGQNAKPGTASADGLRVAHITDAQGNVSFTVENKDAAGTVEQQPAHFTDAPTISLDGLDDIHCQVLPYITGNQEKDDHTVISEIHYYDPASSAPAPVTNPTIRLVLPALTDSNSIHRTDLENLFSVQNTWYPTGIGVRQAYLPTGSSNTLAYHVTDDNGDSLRNATVTLHVNKANSSSNAKVTNGTTPTDSTKNNTNAAGSQDQAVWTGTTDGFGNVFFTLRNLDTVGEPVPATLTTAVPQTGAVFSQLYPEVTAGADHADMTEFHFFGTFKAPTRSVAASITGLAKVGKVLTAKNGTWSGTATIAYTYKWYRCTVIGKTATIAAPASSAKCVVIAGATTSTHKVVAADKGKYLRVLVTATNPAGVGLSLSKSTATKIG
ncbi:MAG: hypothetical protein ORN27_09625 [Rhodoluna sp.]|nr:hypothetical protein [Rhodoluna sp.]